MCFTCVADTLNSKWPNFFPFCWHYIYPQTHLHFIYSASLPEFRESSWHNNRWLTGGLLLTLKNSALGLQAWAACDSVTDLHDLCVLPHKRSEEWVATQCASTLGDRLAVASGRESWCVRWVKGNTGTATQLLLLHRLKILLPSGIRAQCELGISVMPSEPCYSPR